MKKLFLILILLSTSVYADKGDLSLYLGGYTDHMTNKTYGYPKQTINDANWGAGAGYEVIDDLLLTARVYRNSVDQTSTAASIGYTFIKFHGVEFSLQEQAANGYATTKKNGQKTTDMNYKTNLGLCYNTKELGLFEEHNPKFCATSPIAGSNTTSFSRISFYVLIPLTNLLN